MAHDGTGKVKIDPKFDIHQELSIEMVTEFQSMWDGHLGHTSVESTAKGT